MRQQEKTAPAPSPPSFLRRHPVLAAFGALAGLSLFAAYWPVSAVITGVVVAGRASGVDLVAWRWLRSTSTRLANRVKVAWREHEARRGGPDRGREPHAPAAPVPAPAAPPVSQPSRTIAVDRVPTAHLRAPARRGRRQRGIAARDRAASALEERELGG